MTAPLASSSVPTPFIPILMAKYPSPGAVKSRLCQSGELSVDHAAEIARLMLNCSVRRLADVARGFDLQVVLAVTPDDAGSDLLSKLALPTDGPDVHLQAQGDGDLGQRMLRQWNRFSRSAVAFFGGDTPDLPAAHFRHLAAGLTDCPFAIGPTDDGGYWTLAGHHPETKVLSGIRWGSSSVFRQTVARAKWGNDEMAVLPGWHDVDHPQDVISLIHRIDIQIQQHAADEPLIQLRYDLQRILGDTPLAADIRSTV